MAARAVGITMTEDMIEAMMIGTTTVDHIEEEVEEEEDGELLRTGIRYTEDGHLLLTIVVEVTDHVPDLDHTHLVSFYIDMITCCNSLACSDLSNHQR